jgi:ribulose-phosphate 3-epimerase
MIPKYLDQCDRILLMTVHPGFGGQTFIEEVLEKIKFTRDVCLQLNIREGGVTLPPHIPHNEGLPPFIVEVDGGINMENVGRCFDAGANAIVSGTTLFRSKNMAEAIKEMRNKAIPPSDHSSLNQ